MSVLSGKCDLLDHISGMGGWYDKEDHPVKFGDENVHCYYSDLLQDFEAFKKATGGVIHQHIEMEVNRFNIDFLCENIKELNKITNDNGKVIGYSYWGKEYKTLKSLNSKHVYLDKEIELTDLLGFIKYLPYLVSSCCSSNGKETVYISRMSYVDAEELDNYKYGFESKLKDYYEKNLSELYYNVVKNYYTYDLNNRTRRYTIDMNHLTYDEENDYYFFKVSEEEIDNLHDLKYIWSDKKVHSHWTSPRLDKDNKTFIFNKYDIENYLKDDIERWNVAVEYVIVGNRPIVLE